MIRFPAIRRLLRAFHRAEDGVAMIEAAFVLPVMILAFFATVEVTQTIIAKRRLDLIVYTLGDLTSQSKTIGASDLSNIFGSARAVMAPLNTSKLQMRISSVIVNPKGGTCIDWSMGQNMNALSPGGSFVMPDSIMNSPSTVDRDFIVAEAVFPFDAGSHNFIRGTTTLQGGPTYIVPRQSDRVAGDSTIQSSSPCP